MTNKAGPLNFDPNGRQINFPVPMHPFVQLKLDILQIGNGQIATGPGSVDVVLCLSADGAVFGLAACSARTE